MSDLIEFLRAQLDDDERVARQVMAEPGGFYLEPETADANMMTIGAHFLRWTPARVLAEIDAKRRRLCVIEQLDQSADVDAGPTAAELLRIEALPYADREGYREQWRP